MAVYLGSNQVSIKGGVDTSSGGNSELYVFVDSVPYTNTTVIVENHSTNAFLIYGGPYVVAGATITVYSYGDYVLDTITGKTSGNPISFTTITRGQYTFTMPNESVLCTLYYDD